MTTHQPPAAEPDWKPAKRPRRLLGVGIGYWVALAVVLAIALAISLVHEHAHLEWQREVDALATFHNPRIHFVKRQVLPAWFFGVDGERVVEMTYDGGISFVPGAAALDRDTIWEGNEFEGRAMHLVEAPSPDEDFRRARREFLWLERINKPKNDWWGS